MIKVTKEKDRIVIRDTPVMQWIYMPVVAIVASLFVYLIFPFRDGNGVVSLLMLVIPICCAIFVLLTTSITTTTIDKTLMTISVGKKGLVGKSFHSFRFEEVEGGALIMKVVRERGTYFSILLPLVNSQRIQIAAPRMLNRRQYEDVLADANSYLSDGKSEFHLTILNDD